MEDGVQEKYLQIMNLIFPDHNGVSGVVSADVDFDRLGEFASALMIAQGSVTGTLVRISGASRSEIKKGADAICQGIKIAAFDVFDRADEVVFQ